MSVRKGNPLLCSFSLQLTFCSEQPFYGNYSTSDSHTNTVISLTFAYSSIWRRKPWQGLLALALDTWASPCAVADVDLRETLYFLVSRRNIELKTSKHKFTDIIHQNKKGFKGKKLSGTEFSAFHGKIITSFLPRFSRFCLLVILQNPSKIICLTCIWLKFVDTSFHSSQKPPQITHKSCRIKSNRHTFFKKRNRCVKLKTRWGLELGT